MQDRCLAQIRFAAALLLRNELNLKDLQGFYMSKSILILAPQPFFVQRGTPIAVKALTEGLLGAGYRVDLMVYPEGEDIDLAGLTLRRLPMLPGLRNMPPGFSLKKIWADMVMLPMAAWALMRGRFDLVIAVEESAYIASFLKRIFRVPFIFDVDSSIPEQINDKRALPSWLLKFLEGVEARTARRSLAAITCCRALEDLIRGYAPDLPIQTLEDVTLVDERDLNTPPEDWSFPDPVLMYIGNLESYQGVELLMDGFAQAVSQGQPGHLVIIGGTQTHIEGLQRRAAGLKISDRVALLGPRPVSEIGRYLSQATIVASPRTKGRNTPMKVYSYLDSGRPLLATDLPTHTQVLDDTISMLVKPDADDMARGIRTLFDDPDLRSQLAAAARMRVDAEFSPEAYNRKLLTFFRDVIEPELAK